VPAEVCGHVAAAGMRVVYNDAELLAAATDELFAAWDRALELRLHPEAAGGGNPR
jgi:hypothetical protein